MLQRRKKKESGKMSRAFGRWGRQIGPSRLDTMEASQHPASSSQQNSAYHRYVDTIESSERETIKIRIMTWNMHGNVPMGDLEVLFGRVDPCMAPAQAPQNPHRIPQLPMSDTHPYHIVVVSCQECPWGEGGQLMHKIHTAGEIGHAYRYTRARRDMTPADIQAAMSDHSWKDTSAPNSRADVSTDSRPSLSLTIPSADDSILSNAAEHEIITNHEGCEMIVTSRAWSKVCHDWLCRGLRRTCAELLAGSDPDSGVSAHSSPSTTSSARIPSISSVSSLSPQCMRHPPEQLGVYNLLIKERMMGCYTAVYVWRGCADFVRGASAHAVSSGLLAGRMGNKGGVGISVMLGTTRLLFINAHLAAHANRIDARIANIEKIKAELNVNTFLPPDHPQLDKRDITKNFDHCFWCGDLNFRVDISRKHADSLLQQQSYDDALEFDQLRKVLRDGHAFDGFREAPIDFPPTYKYDLQRAEKQRLRHHPSMLLRKGAASVQASELPKKASSSSLSSAVEKRRPMWRRFLRRFRHSEQAIEEEAMQRQDNNLATLTRKSSSSTLSGVSTSSSAMEQQEDDRQSRGGASSVAAHNSLSSKLQAAVRLHRSDSTSSSVAYDSSTKQRVPSWCDRVLWRSNDFSHTDNASMSTDTSHKKITRFLPWKHMHKSSKDSDAEASATHTFLLQAPLDWIHSMVESKNASLLEPFLDEDMLVPSKGQVKVIDYSTIDDEGVQALGARSDHRPVLFSAAIGI